MSVKKPTGAPQPFVRVEGSADPEVVQAMDTVNSWSSDLQAQFMAAGAHLSQDRKPREKRLFLDRADIVSVLASRKGWDRETAKEKQDPRVTEMIELLRRKNVNVRFDSRN